MINLEEFPFKMKKKWCVQTYVDGPTERKQYVSSRKSQNIYFQGKISKTARK